MKNPESQLQIALFEWAKLQRLPHADDVMPKSKIADYMFAYPLGVKLPVATAARLNRHGAKAGVTDIILPLGRGGYFGLYMELKIKPNKLTALQIEWIEKMRRANYRTEIAYSFAEAIQCVRSYLSYQSTASGNVNLI
jgi:hypothetical protein